MMNEQQRIPPIIKLLTGLLVFLVITCILVSKWSPNDGQMFQLLAGVLTTTLGILANQIMPDPKKSPPPGSVTDIHQITQTPPETPKEPRA
jgi:hypothetical protein